MRAASESLISDAFATLSGRELVDALHEFEAVRRQLVAVDQVLLARVEESRVAGDWARSSTVDLLVTGLRVSPGEARARVQAAVDMGPRRALTGEPLPPLHPVVAAAQAAGEISDEHARVGTRCIERIPAAAGPEAPAIAEAMLVEAARHQDPRALTSTAHALLLRLDPDGRQPREDEIARQRSFTVGEEHAGISAARGALTGETAAVWRTIIDALSAPVTGPGGERDERTAAQRRHDALHEAGLRLLRSGTLPDAGGTPVTVLIRTTDVDVADPSGVAVTEHGQILSMAQVWQLLDEAEIMAVGYDLTGAVRECARQQRRASRAQRRALASRDGGCSFPGCTRPASWCEAHHVWEWILGGPTSLDNLCLLCPYHHRHFQRLGWVVTMIDAQPVWTPPPWIDPQQEPIRNTAHHSPDIDFDAHRQPNLQPA